MTLQITALVAALLTLWAVALSNYVSITRGRLGVQNGDGGNPAMALAVRRHANLMENLPLSVVMLGLAEASGLATGWMMVLGTALVLARLIHPFGLSMTVINSPLRIGPTVINHLVNVICALFILWTNLA